jgi:hypothetical protein
LSNVIENGAKNSVKGTFLISGEMNYSGLVDGVMIVNVEGAEAKVVSNEVLLCSDMITINERPI